MNLKIYFCGSIVGGRQDEAIYQRIIAQLKNYGTVLTEIVGAKNVLEIEEGLSAKFIHDQDVDWLQECDVVVAEVTQVSHGVGYEIGRAVAMNKKILLLFRPEGRKKLSAMIAGAANGTTVIYKEYTKPQLPEILQEFLGLPGTVAARL